MNHWESIVNIALCLYKLVSNRKYMHMYKTRNKKEFIPDFLVASLPSIFVITALSLARSNVGKYNHHGVELNFATKQTKERKEIFLGFSRFHESKRKEKSFWVFCKIKEQRRTGKNFKNIKANK